MHKRVPSRWIANEFCEAPMLTEAALREGFSGDVAWTYAHPLDVETLIELLSPGPAEATPKTTH